MKIKAKKPDSDIGFTETSVIPPQNNQKPGMLLKEKLRWIIEEKRTKVTEVAVAVKCSPSTLYNVFKDNDADTNILRRLSAHFGVDLPWWLDEKSNENPFTSKNISQANKFIHSNNNTSNVNTNSTHSPDESKVDLILAKNKIEHLGSLLKEKDKLLEEKDKTIVTQSKTIEMLHETMSLLNNRK